jgi:hypothetical protein
VEVVKPFLVVLVLVAVTEISQVEPTVARTTQEVVVQVQVETVQTVAEALVQQVVLA